MNQNFLDKLRAQLEGYFSFNGFLVSQDDAEQAIRDGVSFKGTNILILIFAIIIASLGLNTNSTAVIIGAMLISPLMGPIIGMGLGLGIEDFDLLKRALRNLVVAAGFSVIAATVYFLISPVSEGHSELLARTSPTIYDVFIGFFGGAAGIFAIGSKNKGNVIPGVAIATALMPPLCTVGYGLATLQMNYFFGALYLFLINSVFICIATFVGVKAMKYHRAATADTLRAKKMRRIVYTAAVLTLLPSIYLTMELLPRLFAENDYAVMCGGSMMYVDAVTKGIDDIPTISPEVRASVLQMLETEGIDALRERLRTLDPEYYSQVDLQNTKRVVHAVEICLQSGVTYTSLRTGRRKPRPFRILTFAIDHDREELFRRINLRTDLMIAAGLPDEARAMLPHRHLNALNTVGYKEMFEYLLGNWTLPFATARLAKNTRVYAKKQLTWLRRDPEVEWLPGAQPVEVLADTVLEKATGGNA